MLTVFGPRITRASLASSTTRRLALVFVGPLAPARRPGTARVLGVDGVEVEAAEAGSVLVPIGGSRARLRVRRLPTAGGEESELEIFFRDATNGHGTYPAGRFVALVPGRTDATASTSTAPAIRSAPTARRTPARRRGGETRFDAITAGERYER